MTVVAPPAPAAHTEPGESRRRVDRAWLAGLAALVVGTGLLTGWSLDQASRSDYYGAIALSMSTSWKAFFYGAIDPAATITLDKIPGSFWVPALFVRAFGFHTWSVVLPNALAAVGAVLLVAYTARRLVSTSAGLVAGVVVATTPILVAVSRSNQPESFFVLGLAAVAWAGTRALTRRSFGWLLAAGGFVALAFQAYMILAWAAWPALGVAWLCTRQGWWRRVWTLLVAGLTSAFASLTWIVAVSLVPADQRPYIGSTLTNSPWEMVFGYNALGRFGSATADESAYRSFAPPFSGDPGVLRLFGDQLAGQIAWLLPAAVVGLVVLWRLRFSRPVTVLLAVWLATYITLFSAVAGMHQFYTAALAVPVGLVVGLAAGLAWRRRSRWATSAIVVTAATTALWVASRYGGYSVSTAWAQAGFAVVALALTWRGVSRGPWVALTTTLALVLTPAAWSVVTISHPSSTNPVAGGVPDLGGGFGGGQGFGGGRGFGADQGGPGGSAGSANAGGQGAGQAGAGQVGAGTTGGFGAGSSDTQELAAYLVEHQGTATYLAAAFGAQTAAPLIIATGGEILPIGGFNQNDPVPTLEQFVALVHSGQLVYVVTSQGRGGDSSNPIRTWVSQNCSPVTGMDNLASCADA